MAAPREYEYLAKFEDEEEEEEKKLSMKDVIPEAFNKGKPDGKEYMRNVCFYSNINPSFARSPYLSFFKFLRTPEHWKNVSTCIFCCCEIAMNPSIFVRVQSICCRLLSPERSIPYGQHYELRLRDPVKRQILHTYKKRTKPREPIDLYDNGRNA